MRAEIEHEDVKPGGMEVRRVTEVGVHAAGVTMQQDDRAGGDGSGDPPAAKKMVINCRKTDLFVMKAKFERGAEYFLILAFDKRNRRQQAQPEGE